MATYGIDLGTTYSCISRIDSSGTPVIIKNTIGEDTTPSVVFFESPYRVTVGREAKEAMRSDSELVVSCIKREMGKPEAGELDFHGVSYSPEMISAFILKDIVKSVEANTGDEVADVVVTVPAYFGVAERQATRVAGEMAGLNVVNLVPEPVAAAIYYGALTPGATRTVLVYDLGGGTFDTTVIRMQGNDVTVVCTDGDHHLGGADWDEKVVDYLCDRFMAEHPDSDAADSEDFLQDLAVVAEKTKKELSSRQSRRLTVGFGGRKTSVELTRETLENITAELLERTVDITERTLITAREHGVDYVDEILLVGGSTRMPVVEATLRQRFGVHPKIHEPDLAVAKGAAMFALIESVRLDTPEGSSAGTGSVASRAGAARVADELGMSADTVMAIADKNVTIVVPRAFGVKVVDPRDPEKKSFLIRHLLPANTPLPAEAKEQFQTAVPDQVEIHIEIHEQAGAVASPEFGDNNRIGEGTIRHLPPLAEGSPIDITFRLDEGGLLRVEAVELKTGGTLEMEIQIGDLSPRQISDAQATVARLS